MSDNDTISRKWLLEQYDAQHEGPEGRARKLIEDAPAVPHEMSAREFAKQLNRMCEATRCSVCPIDSWCYYSLPTHIDDCIALVEKWAREHPEVKTAHPEKRKTYAKDFREKLPNAEMRSDRTDIPIVCRRTCYGKTGKDKCAKSWNGIDDCVACWNEEMEENNG